MGEPDNGLPAERGKSITVTATKVGTNDLQEGIWKLSHIPY
ncbi:hypothetical protein [Paenibacillus eucommiae]|uniref:Uncharacterized protein n=1 Tax=Paenibacillus eucommiae TaxID=1355755 RepID=A0ABS4IV16_9BACL|nr:hypothetical protein [Paenibacillus eucommiae]MBP1990686.1 hypothetical protein [Paenibacillus eucommiae]